MTSLGTDTSKQQLTDLHVFVIDDDEDIVAMTTRVLENAGAQVSSSTRFPDSENLKTLCHVDAIVLDWHLGGYKGADVLRELDQADPKIRERCVLVTGDIRRVQTVSAKEHGSAGVITKPFRPSELVETIAQIVGRDDHQH